MQYECFKSQETVSKWKSSGFINKEHNEMHIYFTLFLQAVKW